MEQNARNVILKNKEKLEQKVDKNKLKPFLKQQNIFSDAMLNDIYDGEYDLFKELLSRGPNAFSKFLQVLRDAGYQEEAKMLYGSGTFKFHSPICYKMVSKPLGFCKIINNVKFEYLSKRDGSDVDAASLNKIFSVMGYVVFPERNLTAYKMRESLEEFAAHDSWDTVDSCVVIILSHGASSNNTDWIYGTDSDYIEKTEIYSMFDNTNCKQLRNKPKIFIFQACRGDNEDNGVTVNTESTDAAKVNKLPSMSDMLIVHSALPNHASYRDEIKGTWFCQDFVQVLSDDYLKYPLETMLQTVDRKIENRLSRTRKKQVTHIDKFGVKADIYFCLNSMTELPEFYTPLCSP